MESLLPIVGAGIFIGLIFDVFRRQEPYIFGEIGETGISPPKIIGNTGISPSKIIGETGISPPKIIGETGISPPKIIGNTGISPPKIIGNTGVIGTREIINPGGVYYKDGKPFIVYPTYTPLYDGKWIPDGRNFKHI